MFLLGFACGLVIVALAIWLFARYEASASTTYADQQSIRDIERQTIRELVAAALVANHPPTSLTKGDPFEVDGRDVEPRA